MVNFSDPPGQPGWVPPPGPPPTGPPAGPPPKKRSPLLIPALIAVALVATSCVGAIGYGGIRLANNLNAAQERAEDGTRPAYAGDTPKRKSDAADDDAPVGPRASSYPVRTREDLGRVCEQWYYPQSPKYKAGSTNPVGVQIKDEEELGWRPQSIYMSSYQNPGATQKAWDPKDPAKARLVACMHRVDNGRKLRSCKFDEPKTTVPMREGIYRLSLYEVATGKRLAEKKVAGEQDECPFMVMLRGDRTIYSGVDERQLYETFRKYVEK
ncbi:hypothetical protein [Jidongwangia harbinensis]|uniref:hypothetical protein n=1 Tax=Jidongwangia harbinensis TaxID=2878561 RepID=UPI001CDA3652|nr:hypothetical protein [Jidongwangia harbinensis]MCA2218105.1 hypothetical protein [Jidongwangia harbinensis]